MSLPPQTLNIKRKRVEDPVDTLYIESPKRRNTEHAFVFRRLQQQLEEEHSVTLPSTHSAGVPPILTTRPDDDLHHQKSRLSRSAHTSPTSKSHVSDENTTPKEPRRFLLSKEGLSHAGPVTGKRKASQLPMNIALFVESNLVDDSSAAQPKDQQPGELSSSEPELATRKRPRTMKARNAGQNKENALSDQTQQLMQQYAAELDAETKQNTVMASPAEGNLDDAMDTSDDDFVYDTYVRHARIDDDQPVKPLASVGYLVIPEADQTLWETYYDTDADSGDERDWDSEQDDENAENYYGADYPEDEVDSHDELDEAPYRYHKGSDEEEYGSEDEAWSDVHDERQDKWIDVTTMQQSTYPKAGSRTSLAEA